MPRRAVTPKVLKTWNFHSYSYNLLHHMLPPRLLNPAPTISLPIYVHVSFLIHFQKYKILYCTFHNFTFFSYETNIMLRAHEEDSCGTVWQNRNSWQSIEKCQICLPCPLPPPPCLSFACIHFCIWRFTLSCKISLLKHYNASKHLYFLKHISNQRVCFITLNLPPSYILPSYSNRLASLQKKPTF